MAIDILSILPMSDDIEKVFSGTRRLITWCRSRLKPGSIQAVECTCNWLVGGIIRCLTPQRGRDSTSIASSVVLDSVEGQDMSQDEDNDGASGSEGDFDDSDSIF
jgi:hypothetical protein